MIVLMTASSLAAPGARLLTEAGHQLRLLTSAAPAAEMARVLACEPVAAIISRTLPVTAAHIASCPTLRIISRHGVGFDNVDLAAATAAGIPVTVADAGNAQSVAELTIGLMLAAARGIPTLDQQIRAGRWDRSGAGLQLAGRRLGLVAYGSIGRAVARIARGIGMTIAVFDPHAVRDDSAVWADDLQALLRISDVLSLHVPLTGATRGMIGAHELALLPKGALVVNTARGGLIDEQALAASIRAGHVAAAGIDTFAEEPLPPGHPFLSEARVVMTPHMGGSTDAALAGVALSAARNVVEVLAGRQPDPRLLVNGTVLQGAAE